MASTTSGTILGLDPEVIAVVAGVTLATYVSSEASQVSLQLRHVSGGTLRILNAASGSTMAGATLAALDATNSFYTVIGEILKIGGAPAFYLAATGATAVVHLMREKNSAD